MHAVWDALHSPKEQFHPPMSRARSKRVMKSGISTGVGLGAASGALLDGLVVGTPDSESELRSSECRELSESQSSNRLSSPASASGAPLGADPSGGATSSPPSPPLPFSPPTGLAGTLLGRPSARTVGANTQTQIARTAVTNVRVKILPAMNDLGCPKLHPPNNPLAVTPVQPGNGSHFSGTVRADATFLERPIFDLKFEPIRHFRIEAFRIVRVTPNISYSDTRP